MTNANHANHSTVFSLVIGFYNLGNHAQILFESRTVAVANVGTERNQAISNRSNYVVKRPSA